MCHVNVLTMYGIDDIGLAKGMHIAHMNVRSIVNKWEIFKTHFSSSNLHILGISETWLNNKLPNELFSLSNEYCLYRNDRGWTETGNLNVKKGGVVAIYVKHNLKSSNVEFQHLNNNSRDIESQWISIRQPNCKTIIIGNIYVLKTMDWEKVIKEKDPEISWKVLEENLFSALDGLAPMSEMKVSQNPPPLDG